MNGPHAPPPPASAAPRSAADRALAARMLAAAKSGGDVRRRKVRRVRTAIRSRTYENELKLAVALDRLCDLTREDAALLATTPPAARRRH